MNLKNNFHYTLITSIMILISFLGLTFREPRQKYFYIPIGIIGFYLVAQKEYKRKVNRENILNKIKQFQENK